MTDPTLAPQTPTQVVFPWRAAVRTAVQAFLAFATLTAVTLPILTPFLADYLPDEWVAWLIAAGVFVSALAGVVARIMALPQLQAFLSSVGLGATPRP